MNIALIIGTVISVGMIFLGIFTAGDLSAFYDPISILIVFGGTFGVLIASFPLSVTLKVPKLLKIALFSNKTKPEQYIAELVEYARIARGKGLLALEESANNCKDPFMKQSLMLIVDANDPDKVRTMLEDAISFMEERHAQGRAYFEKGAALAPAFGMLGTLIGLILMLRNLGHDPDSLGPSMAVALVTTFYGSVLSNILFVPIENSLKAAHDKEVLCMQIVVEGVIAIAAGSNPRFIQEKLEFMLPKDAAAKSSNEPAKESGGRKK